jgi:hypothetical protein
MKFGLLSYSSQFELLEARGAVEVEQSQQH